jgi:hypothetical protein
MSTFSQNLQRSPEAYPHTWDLGEERVLFVQMHEAGYAKAAFLDQRALAPQTKGQWSPMEGVAPAVAEAVIEERLGFIFHIGHVGSTLISRLIGGERILSLREPTPLRVLAQIRGDLPTAESYQTPMDYDRELAMFLKLWSRTWRDDQLAVVKASSFAADCAEDIMRRPGCTAGLMLYATPQAYICGILAGPNSRMESKVLSQARLRRLHARLGTDAWRLHALSEGERVAMSWAAEMTALVAGVEDNEDKALWMDFDQFLAAPEPALGAVFDLFGVDASPAELQALATGPIMGQYSKAPEHKYDAKLRRQVLDEGRDLNPRELADGMAWLEAAAKDWPEIAAALEVAS